MTAVRDNEPGLDRVFNLGVTQSARLETAPQPGTVPVDGRSRAELLAFPSRYGELIRFFDLERRPDGDWSEFFARDPLMLQVRLASLDLPRIAEDGDRILHALLGADEDEARGHHLSEARQHLRRLLRALDGGHATRHELRPMLTRALRADRDRLFAGPLELLADWLVDAGDGLPAGREPPPLQTLENAHAGLLAQLTRQMATARKTLATAERNGLMRPQLALWCAFAELFGTAQDSINTFPTRFLDFYYGQVLLQTRTDSDADAGGVAPDAVGTATATTAATAANSAAFEPVSSLRMLRRVPSDSAEPLSTPKAIQVLSGAASLPALADGSAPAASVQLFGSDRAGTQGVLTTTEATLGFAIVSPMLTLAGGERAVSLALTLSDESWADLRPQLQAIGQGTGDMAAAAVLAQLLQSGFDMFYSSAGGWVPVPACQVVAPTQDAPGPYQFQLALPASAAPLQGLSCTPPAPQAVPPAAGSAVPSADQPTLLFKLNQAPVTLSGGGAPVHPYAVLQQVVLSHLQIGVKVQGLRELDLRNDAGPVSAGQLFMPFGSPPVQHSSLLIGAPELFAKTPTGLSLSLIWSGLPDAETGFQGYYQNYTVDANGQSGLAGSLFDNTSFQADMDVLSPGGWTIPPAAVEGQTSQASTTPSTGASSGSPGFLYLFRTSSSSSTPAVAGTLLADTLLKPPQPLAQPLPAAYDPALSRLRLRLTAPSYAFGNTLYAANINAAALRNASMASACAQKCAKRQVPAGKDLSATQTKLQDAQSTLAQAGTGDGAKKAKVALQEALVQLKDSGIAALRQAISDSSASSRTQGAWKQSLKAALDAAGSGSWTPPWKRSDAQTSAQAAALAQRAQAWLKTHASQMGQQAQGKLQQANALLASTLQVADADAASASPSGTVQTESLSQALRLAQARISSAGGSLQQCMHDCMGSQTAALPNAPWLPVLADIHIAYESSVALDGAKDGSSFHRLLPQDGVDKQDWSSRDVVRLLEPVDDDGQLSFSVPAVAQPCTLQWSLVAPSAGWPEDPPPVIWQRQTPGGWSALSPMEDATQGLRQSGRMRFDLGPEGSRGDTTLRVSVARDAGAMPCLAALGVQPAPASEATEASAASMIDEGTPSATDTGSTGSADSTRNPAFQVWMAERLRHKDVAVQAWDHGRLVLARFPQVWQVGVAPATDGDGRATAGHVWVVLVPGADASPLVDPTAPLADPQNLDAVQAYLQGRVSAQVRVTVTNPPYVRVRVSADLLFSDAMLPVACQQQLNRELIEWLSPWQPADLGARHAHYFTRQGIAEFIRKRSYVLGITSLVLSYDPPRHPGEWRYITSALEHAISGGTAAPLKPLRRSLPQRPPGVPSA